MKILWITNMMMPPVAIKMGKNVKAGGGWMYSSLKRLKNLSNVELSVATVYSGHEYVSHNIDGVKYLAVPLEGHSISTYNKHLEAYWSKIQNEIKPDVVHIHGTEYPHGLAFIRATNASNIVVSIQGLVSKYSDYYLGNIPRTQCIKYLSFHDLVKNNSLLRQQKLFRKRGELEIELLRNVRHVIGRTEWDKSNVWAINPQANYHHCGETMRDEFYKHKWSYAACEPHTIFVSQAGYPIKGFHKLLEYVYFLQLLNFRYD